MKKLIISMCAVMLCTATLLVFTSVINNKVSNEVKAQSKPKQVQATSSSKAPLFQAPMINGKEGSLGDFIGHPILLNMWTSWCGKCEEDLISLKSISKMYKKTELQIVTVNLTSQEYKKSDVKNMVNRMNLLFPIFLDQKGDIMREYHVYGIPTSFLIDQSGMIIHIFYGVVTPKDINQWLPGTG